MKRLIIIGAGGMGREVLQCAKQINEFEKRWDIAGFLDPDRDALRGKKCEYTVIGNDYDYEIQVEDEFVCAAGDGVLRAKLIERLKSRGAKFTTLVHPSALIADTAEIGEGTIIFANAIVSDNVKIGTGCFINYQSLIGHDVIMEDYCTIFSNCVICGACRLKTNVTMGTASNIIPGITASENAYICAGSTVMRNVRKDARVIGVPAGPMRIRG